MGNSLSWTIVDKEGSARIELAGEVTEDSDFRPLLEVTQPTIVLDLADVRRINSCGVREWIGFVNTLSSTGRTVVMERCSVAIVHQLNMIMNFRGNAEVVSVFAAYFCAKCGVEHSRLIDLRGEAKAELEQPLPCPTCGAAMEFDDLPDTYLAFRD